MRKRTPRFSKITAQVYYTLNMWPDTRSSDRSLIKTLYRHFYGVGDEPFSVVMDRTDLPSFESIRRTRQKVQETHEELRAIPEIEEQRIALQEDYIDYARGGDKGEEHFERSEQLPV